MGFDAPVDLTGGVGIHHFRIYRFLLHRGPICD
jgi:hypothetical protein